MSNFSLDLGLIYPKCRIPRFASLLFSEIMPNRYPEPSKSTATDMDSGLTATVTQSTVNSWPLNVGEGGNQIKMYNLQEFSQQQTQPISDVSNHLNWMQSNATAQVSESDDWSWSNNGQPDPWAWGSPTPGTSTVSPESGWNSHMVPQSTNNNFANANQDSQEIQSSISHPPVTLPPISGPYNSTVMAPSNPISPYQTTWNPQPYSAVPGWDTGQQVWTGDNYYQWSPESEGVANDGRNADLTAQPLQNSTNSRTSVVNSATVAQSDHPNQIIENSFAMQTSQQSTLQPHVDNSAFTRMSTSVESVRATETINSLAGHAPHLFNRSDSWLSSSSLQTFNDSLSGSQDMLDASHFMPAETVEVVRQHMAEMALKESEQQISAQHEDKKSTDTRGNNLQDGSTGNSDVDTNRNQEVVEEQGTSIISDTVENQENNLDNVPASAKTKENDRVRQPPDGAATKSPVVTATAFQPLPATGGTATTRSSARKSNVLNSQPLTIPDEDTQISGEDSNSRDTLNVEAPVVALSAPSVSTEASRSPFKPPVKSSASIPAVVQQEVTDVDTVQSSNVTSVRVNQEYDNGANLEMTPDNAEQPPTDVLEPQSHGSLETTAQNDKVPTGEVALKQNDVVTIPTSSALWNNPEPKQANIFLVPAASNNPVQQNVLIVPPLTEQLLDSSLLSPAGPNIQTENVEDVSKIDKKPLTKPAAIDQPLPITALHSTPLKVQTKPITMNPDQVPYQSAVAAEFRQEMTSNNPPDVADSKNLLACGGDNISGYVTAPASQPLLLERPAAGDQQRMVPAGGNYGQRPPVPGLGPVQPLRSTSEPPTGFIQEGEGGGRGERILNREVERMNRERDDNVRYPEQEERSRVPRNGRQFEDRDQYYDNRINDERNWRAGYHPDRPSSRSGRDEDRGYRNRPEEWSRYNDDPYYHHERDRSRPSSRQSMDEREHYRGRDENDYYDRDPGGRPPPPPPSNRDHYERDSARFPRDHDPYRERERDRDRGRYVRGYDDRPPSRGGYDSDRESGQDRYNNRRGSVDDRRERDDPYRKDPRHYSRDPRYYDQYYRQYYNQYGAYGYNNFNYGYYDELYRNDPRFRAQYNARLQQYYAAYYGYDGNSDQRSVQSGRSSVNDDIQREREKFPEDFQNATDTGGNYPDQSSIYPDYDQTNRSYYATDQYTTEEPPKSTSRLTPAKFSIPHVRVQFTTSGHLVKLLPNNPSEGQPGVVEIHELQDLLGEDLHISELKNYPGPLVKGETHKNDVIQFCMEKIKAARGNIALTDQASYILIWELLILLVRQNGTVVGTDIAELLLKDHNMNPQNGNDESAETSPVGTVNAEIVTPDEGISVINDRSVISRFSEEAVTRKFREYLLFGRKKEALEKSMKNGLWGHALFLASKMDNRTYANVMTRFANSLTLNDPLQTLYQMMSGRQPAAVTCVAEEKWGDWRPHLAMILSNPTQRPDLDRKSVMTMGDTLAARGLILASQFCYLMAQIDFGNYLNKSSKLVLIGANHSLQFEQFATNEAIQCTEVYEYAQQLANSNFIIASFQTYRFVYALRLAEAGMPQESLHYCEVIGNAVCKMPALFHPVMVAQVYELASKLKFHHHYYTSLEGDISEISDPDWLIQLKNVLQAYNMGRIQPISEDTGYQCLSGSSSNITGSENGDVMAPTATHASVPTTVGPVYDTTEVNQSQLDQTYSDYYQQENYTSYQTQSQPGGSDPSQFAYSGGDYGGYYQPYATNYQPNVTDDPVATQYASSGVDAMQSSADVRKHSGTETMLRNSGEPDYWDQTTTKTPTQSSLSKTTEITSVSSKTTTTKTLEKSEGKNKNTKNKQPSSGSGSSWLGGIFSKFLPKAPNQMKLPDDRNPTIVWDPVTKSWMNTDNDEDEVTNSPAAPPRDSEIVGGRKSSLPQNGNINDSNSINGSSQNAGLPPTDFNKFRRLGTGKGLTSHQRYVDVVAKSASVAASSPMPPHLLPGMDVASGTQYSPQLFIPSAVSNGPASVDSQMEYSPYGNQPQVGNPGSRPSSPTHIEDTEGMLEPPVQQQVSDAPAQLPMMFNPSLLAQQATPFTTATTNQQYKAPNRLSQYGRRYPR